MSTMKDTTTNPPQRKKTDFTHPELSSADSGAICNAIQGWMIQSKKFTFARLILITLTDDLLIITKVNGEYMKKLPSNLPSGILPGGGRMATHWYAYQSKPNKEEALVEQLRARDIETYYPWIRVNPVNPRARRARAYFPGYVFIRVDLAEIGITAIQFIPFARGLVSFDQEPAIVPDHLLAAIRKRVDDVNAGGGMEFEGLTEGAPVYIYDGPFQGYEGIFDTRLSGSERVRVLVQLLSKRLVPVEMGVGQVRPDDQEALAALIFLFCRQVVNFTWAGIGHNQGGGNLSPNLIFVFLEGGNG